MTSTPLSVSLPLSGHSSLMRHAPDRQRITPKMDRFRKRGRVESCEVSTHSTSLMQQEAATVHYPHNNIASRHVIIYNTNGRRHVTLSRSSSLPNLYSDTHDHEFQHIFPDLNPRELRIAEVRSWKCPWMDRDINAGSHSEFNSAIPAKHSPPLYPRMAPPVAVPSDELDTAIQELTEQLSLEANSEVVVPVMKPVKRPTLRLKLEDMPTPQQAEDRAQRAANRIIARRDALERETVQNKVDESNGTSGDRVNVTQKAMLRLNLKSYSSGEDSDMQSPSDAGRHSAGSSYSPNHGMFTTKSVAVSEAGISSPDSACLHLQENLERVKEIGRGASGVVYKAIHIPTLKVVAVKDVPVYGRGQRRQMVRELHALYSNLVPIVSNPNMTSFNEVSPPAVPRLRPTPSPYIVSFYDAFVDRSKNCICLVMEYMSGGSLQDIVLRGGCQNEKVLARLATGVVYGLYHIHQKNMIHRDIKPHNLLTNRQGDVKISDFGLAKTLNDTCSMTKTFVGTLLYMAPERIGGGDYSYPADIWSFGLALISVALGKYPLPTQEGFFGLVDSVANEKCLELPEDKYSSECRNFIHSCLRIEPSERPAAHDLLHHPFLTKYSEEETLQEWMHFTEQAELCEDRNVELEALSDAVYRHIYERNVKFSYQPQSDYGASFLSQAVPSFSRRQVTIQAVPMSLQLGLANHLGLPVHHVYEQFEVKRCLYSDKLLEDFCYSPQSWTASPGIARRQQLFGSDVESPRVTTKDYTSGSFWKKLRGSLIKFKNKRKKSKGSSEQETLQT